MLAGDSSYSACATGAGPRTLLRATTVTVRCTGPWRSKTRSPGFNSRDAFLHAGGEHFNYVPCLNDAPGWVAALAALAERHLQGWQTRASPAAQDSSQQRKLALAMGATD